MADEPKTVSRTTTGDLDIARVATLARLDIPESEAHRYQEQLAGILAHFERLKQVDVSAVEPTAHAFPVHNVWADDVARPGLSVEAALRNAPAQRDHMIVVPKVVE